MKITLHTSSLGRCDLDHVLLETSRLGYQYVELAADISLTPHFPAHTANPGDVAGLTRLLHQHDLELSAIDIGGWDSPLCIANLNKSERATAVENVKHTVEVAGDLGCRLVTSHLWGLPKEHPPNSKTLYVEAFMASVSELYPLLERAGVRMAFMPHPGGLVEGSDAAVDLIRDAECLNIGYIYGTGHGSILCRPDQDTAQMIEYAGGTLLHVSVSDSHDSWRIIAPPDVKAHEHSAIGEGDVDFKTVFRALRGGGYDGFLSVHLISEVDRIDEAATLTRQRLEQLIRG